MRHRDGSDADVAAHHDDPGAFVDHDLGGEVRFDLQLLDLGQERDDVALEFGRDRQLHGGGIDRLGGLDAEEVVDRGGNAFGGGEVGVAQRQPDIGQAIERELDLAFDDGAVGDPADRRHAAGDAGGGAFGRESGDRDRTLRNRVDVAVGAEQGGDQQRAAGQVLGIAKRGDGDVHPRSLGAERGQIAGGADGGAADVDAHALEHRLQRLLGEGDVVQRIAGAVEADDEAVADQLVLPHAFDIGEILDPRGRIRRRGRQHQRQQRGAGHPDYFCRTDAGHPVLPSKSQTGPQRHSHDGDPPLTMRDRCHPARCA